MFDFDYNLPDSSHIAFIWRTRSGGKASFISRAASQWEIVITKQYGQTKVTLRGPETKASSSDVPEDAEFLGIPFKHGSFMPQFPLKNLVNAELTLPEASSKKIWIQGSAWQIPNFEDADLFIAKLIREGLLLQDPLIDAVLKGEVSEVSERTLQRRFLQVTGISQTTLRQIERAREATALLEKGVAIADVVYLAGYADQPHLSRAMRRFAGQTPSELKK